MKKKRYFTKKRKIERRKWQLVIGLFLVAVIGITIHRNVVETEIVLASEVLAVNIPKTPPEPVLSVSEHIWGILTDEYNLTLEEKATAMRIIDCESKFDPMAIGDRTLGLSLGVWQIHEPSHGDKEGYSRECSFDVYCSTRFAMDEIYLKSGFYPWSCY